MVENTLPYLNVLLQDFEEKMNHVEACLYHGDRNLRELEDDLQDSPFNDQLVEAKAFVSTGYDDIREVKDIYHALRKGAYQCQKKDMLLWAFHIN